MIHEQQFLGGRETIRLEPWEFLKKICRLITDTATSKGLHIRPNQNLFHPRGERINDIYTDTFSLNIKKPLHVFYALPPCLKYITSEINVSEIFISVRVYRSFSWCG